MTVADSTERGENDAEEVSSEAIETVAFLARSEHRVHVLSLLDDDTCTREQLSEAVDVTRVTLSRILGDLEDRELIVRDIAENAYELTHFGRLVYQDVDRLLGTVSIGQAHPDVVKRLPTEWLDFDLRCLADAEVVTGGETDLMSAARVVANAVQNASSRKALLGTFLSLPLYTFEEAVRAGDEPNGAVVFDADVAETMLTESDLQDRWQTIEGIATVPVYYRIDECVPCSVSLIDGETVFLTVEGDGGTEFDVLRCTHPEVVEWADRVIDEYRAEARPLRQCLDGSV